MDLSWVLTPLAVLFAEHGEGGGLSPVGTPIWVPLVVILIVLLLLWWGLTRNTIVEVADGHGQDNAHDGHQRHEGAGEGHDHASEHAAVATEAPVQAESVETAEPDNLRRIEGIGPKIASVLNEAGIFTFAQLAETSVERLNQIVREDAGITIAFPDTWPEQSALAAAGKWDELEQLQDDLKGGRRDS